MSKLFYDHLIRFERLEVHISTISSSNEEKEELWGIVDRLVHNRVIHRILELLPGRHHEEFTEMLHNRPFDKTIIQFLSEYTNDDIEKYLVEELTNLENEILHGLENDE